MPAFLASWAQVERVVEVGLKVVEVLLIVFIRDHLAHLDPLVAGGHGIDAPMNEQAKTIVDEPAAIRHRDTLPFDWFSVGQRPALTEENNNDSAEKTKDLPQMTTDKQRMFTDVFRQSLERQWGCKIICALSVQIGVHLWQRSVFTVESTIH